MQCWKSRTKYPNYLATFYVQFSVSYFLLKSKMAPSEHFFEIYIDALWLFIRPFQPQKKIEFSDTQHNLKNILEETIWKFPLFEC